MTIEELLKGREGKMWGPEYTAQVLDHLRKVDALAQKIFDAELMRIQAENRKVTA
jgi:hypothetical protein